MPLHLSGEARAAVDPSIQALAGQDAQLDLGDVQRAARGTRTGGRCRTGGEALPCGAGRKLVRGRILASSGALPRSSTMVTPRRRRSSRVRLASSRASERWYAYAFLRARRPEVGARTGAWTWVQVNCAVFPQGPGRPPYVPWEELLAALQAWRADGRFACSFFMRKPPGLRLRFRGAELEACLEPTLVAWLEQAVLRNEIRSFHFARYGAGAVPIRWLERHGDRTPTLRPR